jgi:hypothetical protein
VIFLGPKIGRGGRGFLGIDPCSRSNSKRVVPALLHAWILGGALACALVLAAPASAFAGGDANRASCPQATEESPGFRSYLPDCRAYEQVTPPYKQGYPIHLNGVDPAGGRLFGRSLANLAQTEGPPGTRGSIGAEYGFVRGLAGWTPIALTPPNPEFRGAVTVDGVGPDGATTIFKMPSAPAGQDDFYLRRGDGGLADVGPASPPADGPTIEPAPEGVPVSAAEFRGASADLSHIVFSVQAPWGWPGDTSLYGAQNLYEYSGSGNAEPRMVAVSGARASTELIDPCGASLGGPQFTSAFNAVSASGAVIVFTPIAADELPCFDARQPARAELYARIDGERTVELSAPQCDPSECPQSTLSDAVFGGATSDGERGWFLSTQQLTATAVEDPEPGDSANGSAGGGCQDAIGSGCNLYEYDLTRPPGELLRAVSKGGPRPHVQGVVRISSDGSHVYFVATGKLAALPGPGGSEPTEGQNNLYVSEALGGGSQLRFVATLAEGDQELWGGSYGSDESRPAATSADGANLLFASSAALAPGSAGVSQLFLYRDGAAPDLRRISVPRQGFEAGAGSEEFAAAIIAPDYEGREAFRPQARPLSADGQIAVFESAAALTPGAGPAGGAAKLYEYRDGEVYLLDPDPDGSARLIGLGESGRDAFFETARALLPSDGDTQTDIYDARVEGGFPDPDLGATCSGEACLGSPGAAELPARPGSLDFRPPRHRAHLREALRACRRKAAKRARRRCERAVRHRRLRGAPR